MTKQVRFTALFDPLTLARARALAAVRQVPAYQVLNEAAEEHYQRLTPEERTHVDQLVEVWQKKAE